MWTIIYQRMKRKREGKKNSKFNQQQRKTRIVIRCNDTHTRTHSHSHTHSSSCGWHIRNGCFWKEGQLKRMDGWMCSAWRKRWAATIQQKKKIGGGHVVISFFFVSEREKVFDFESVFSSTTREQAISTRPIPSWFVTCKTYLDDWTARRVTRPIGKGRKICGEQMRKQIVISFFFLFYSLATETRWWGRFGRREQQMSYNKTATKSFFHLLLVLVSFF